MNFWFSSICFLKRFHFSGCRKGDYYRYLAEFKVGNDRKEAADQSLKAYQVYKLPIKCYINYLSNVLVIPPGVLAIYTCIMLHHQILVYVKFFYFFLLTFLSECFISCLIIYVVYNLISYTPTLSFLQRVFPFFLYLCISSFSGVMGNNEPAGVMFDERNLHC